MFTGSIVYFGSEKHLSLGKRDITNQSSLDGFFHRGVRNLLRKMKYKFFIGVDFEKKKKEVMSSELANVIREKCQLFMLQWRTLKYAH